MRRFAWLLIAACSSPSKPTTQPAPPSPVEPTPAVVAPAPVPDSPELVARKAFKNPGGMWLPTQLGLPLHVETLGAMGVRLDLTNPLGDPLNAVVTLGFCTGSFVSPDGLLITNHHCAQAALDRNSTK